MATQPAERPGAAHRIVGWVSEVGRSFFPSMGLQDWRSVLRPSAGVPHERAAPNGGAGVVSPHGRGEAS